MEAKVVRWGDDFAVRLTIHDVEHLGIAEGQTVEITAKPSDVVTADAVPTRRWVGGLPVYMMAEMIAEARRLGPDAEPPTVEWGPDRGSEIIDDDADPY